MIRKTILTFDLDNTIFDISELYKKAWDRGHPRKKSLKEILFNKKVDNGFAFPKYWDYYQDLDWLGQSAIELDKIFLDDYELSSIDTDYLTARSLNNIIHNPFYEVYFVTNRPLYIDTYWQIERNDIIIDREHVITTRNKNQVIYELGSVLHFDDAPHVLDYMIDKSINVVVISNDHTIYNHEWVKEHPNVPCYKNIKDALEDLERIKQYYYLA